MVKRIILFLWITLCLAASATAASKKFTLVIDAGHGGHDVGAPGAISKEKNLTLRYALAFGRTIERNCSDVKVVYTRKTDVFIELWQRAEIANKAKADLFVSVHINALPKGRVARGYQTYTLGKGRNGTAIIKNLDVAKRENSVILMEDNYRQTYQGYDPNSPESDILFEFIQDKNMERSVELAKQMQRHICSSTGRANLGAHQENLAVLRLTAMPACLMELGFITTPDEEQFLNSDEALKLYCQGFLNAFLAYRNKLGQSITVPYEPEPRQPVEIPSLIPSQEEPTPAVEQPQAQVVEQPTATEPAATEQPAVTETVARTEPEHVDTPLVVKPEPPKKETKPDNNADADAPVFKVQITASNTKLKANSPELKGVKNVDYYRDGGMYKYTVGASTNYNEISRLRKELTDKFPEAFVIAFKNGQRCDVQQAIQEFKKRKKKK
ncbi:MAG: N-acetylmuramoyl-L-alanine amidase [Prevotella sp.]|nr:N-acetylmuramoyl-L-alanine amidase [Prevotella sp.]